MVNGNPESAQKLSGGNGDSWKYGSAPVLFDATMARHFQDWGISVSISVFKRDSEMESSCIRDNDQFLHIGVFDLGYSIPDMGNVVVQNPFRA